MQSFWLSLIVFCVVFGGAFIGVAIQARLPARHLEDRSKDTIQLIMGLVASMAALVLSLLIASSHAFFDTQQQEVQKLASNVVLLDEALSRFGPETKRIRQVLRDDVIAATGAMSPDEGVGSASVTPGETSPEKQHLFESVQALSPKTSAQQFDQAKAIDLMGSIASTRLLIHEQSTSSVPTALVVVMVSWLTLLFVGFGLFARVNATVIVAFGFGAFSVAAAIFLILDMGHPYRGLIHVSGVPIQTAIEQISR